MKLRYAVLLVMVFVAVPLISSAQVLRAPVKKLPSPVLKTVLLPYGAAFVSCSQVAPSNVKQIWNLSSHPTASMAALTGDGPNLLVVELKKGTSWSTVYAIQESNMAISSTELNNFKKLLQAGNVKCQ